VKPTARSLRRRHFLRGASLLSAATLLPHRVSAASAGTAGGTAPAAGAHRPVLGQGGFRYRQVPGWGTLDATTPVNNCHGLARGREGHGFISVLDADFRVVSNIGGQVPRYNDAAQLQKMGQKGDVFNHPHDLLVDDDDSLYVAQFSSGRTYPLKFERI